MSLWKVWRYNLTVKSIIKAKWKGNNPKFTPFDCACVCVRSGTDGVSRGGDQVAEQTTQQIPQSFSVRCVFFFCVCVRERARERQVYAFGLCKVCDCMCVVQPAVLCQPQAHS